MIGFSAQILDNKFLGPGRSALVEIAEQSVTDNLSRRFERVFFNNNFCWHVSVAAQSHRYRIALRPQRHRHGQPY